MDKLLETLLETRRLTEEQWRALLARRDSLDRAELFALARSTYQSGEAQRVPVTFYAMLRDTAGVLSRVLAVFATSGANILTINQSIPTNGCAAVTISAETSEMEESVEQLMSDVANLEDVIKFEILAG